MLRTAELRERFASAAVARLATVRPDGAPHLVPVVFAMAGDVVWFAVDAKPKRTTQLQRLTNPRAQVRGDEAMIKERLTGLQELESRNAAEMRKAYNALDEVLDVRQQARFRVFEEQIERRKIELLMRARQQNRQNNQQGPNANPPVRRPPG